MTTHGLATTSRRHRDAGMLWPITIVVLGIAGGFKDTAILRWIPLDVTILSAAIAALGVALYIYRHNGYIATSPLPVVALWLTFIPGAAIASLRGYGLTKTAVLFTLTFLVALAPFVLITDHRAVRMFIRAQFGSALVAAPAVFILPSHYDIIRGQLGIEGASTISVGRIVGVGALIASLSFLRQARLRILSLAIALALLSVTLAVGNRASLLAYSASIVITVVYAKYFQRIRVAAIIGLGAATALAMTLIISGVIRPSSRVQSLFALMRSADGSVDTRTTLSSLAAAASFDRPIGEGWDGFSKNDSVQLVLGATNYPHNILLEIVVEGGWLAGGAFIVYVVLALRRAHVRSDHPLGMTTLGLIVYWTTAALFSEDINGNRMMWATLAVGLVLPSVLGDAPRKSGSGALPARRVGGGTRNDRLE